MFDHDWFHRGGLERLRTEAKARCARRKFVERGRDEAVGSTEFTTYQNELDTRVILYMKDGLTYEMREIADVESTAALTFECVPADENYKVGAIVLVVPFEDVARVEVFAVHPDEKPQENLRIPGFRSGAADGGRE